VVIPVYAGIFFIPTFFVRILLILLGKCLSEFVREREINKAYLNGQTTIFYKILRLTTIPYFNRTSPKLRLKLMTIAQAKIHLTQALSTIYDQREAESITRIMFEDIDFLKNRRPEDTLNGGHAAMLNKMQSRLLTHEPFQYVLGEADFYGLKFKVNPNVLIPRPETEELVQWIKNDITRTVPTGAGKSLLDIGSGSGCIALTLKSQMPDLDVTALDVGPLALKVVRENAAHLDLNIRSINLDILDTQATESLPVYDYIVSNPPYVLAKDKTEMHPNVLKYEPHLALFVSDDDPLLFYRQISLFAQKHLRNGGALYFEIHEKQAIGVQHFLEKTGFQNIVIQKDMSGKDRMIKGIKAY